MSIEEHLEDGPPADRTARRNAELTRDLSRANDELEQLRQQLSIIEAIELEHQKPPAWLSPKKNPRSHRGTVTLMLSDLHLDEIVQPGEIGGVNSFNRRIAEQRLRATFERAIMTARDYLAGVTYDGLVLLLGGDLISGWIHEELSETNETTVPATVVYWLDPIAAGIGMLAEEFGRLHIAGVVGNHGRVTKKPRAKLRAQDNIDWLIYKMLARDFRDDQRITWQVPDSPDAIVPVYDTRFLLTHGDQFKGGSGIAGALSPLMLGHHRKVKRQMAISQPFDHLVMGHWHTYWSGKGIIVNGSLKGYDEYAFQSNFDFEPPQQAMWLTTPERGVTFSWAVQPQDRKREKW